MKAYLLFHDDDRARLADELTQFEQAWESVEVLQMNSVTYCSGDYDERIVETTILVRYETGDEAPAPDVSED